MNVDSKILTKLLSLRLKYVLPTIIHETQSAVYGRRIHNTVHLVRDIIDLANQENEEAALLFLDQEKYLIESIMTSYLMLYLNMDLAIVSCDGSKSYILLPRPD